MKYIKVFEKFTKEYQQKIDVKDFKKRIKKGSKVQYMGGTVDVIDNNGYVLTLKGEDGKKFTVNKNQFDHGGRISESLTIKGKKVKKINKKGNDPENWTITYKDGTEEPYLQHMRESMIGITTDKSFKPADLQKALDKAKIKGYKMDRLSMTLTALKLDKKYFNDAKKLIDDLGLSVMMAKESVNEAKDQWKEEREYIKQMADDDKSSVYKMADYVQFLGLMTQRQWEKFMYGMYKKDLQKTDTKTKNKIYKVFTKMFEGNLFELSSQQDGTKDSNGKHKHEDHIEEDIEAMWKKTYGEDFVKHYPAIVKIIRQRKIKDKREIARIWQDTYGEDFEKEYPALYNKL